MALNATLQIDDWIAKALLVTLQSYALLGAYLSARFAATATLLVLYLYHRVSVSSALQR